MCVCVCTRVLGFVWRGYEGASAGPGRSLVLCSKDDAGAHAHSLNRVDWLVAVIYILPAIAKIIETVNTGKNLYSLFQVFTKIWSSIPPTPPIDIYIYTFDKNKHCSLNYAIDMQIWMWVIKLFHIDLHHVNFWFIFSIKILLSFYSLFSLTFSPSVK